MTNYLKRMLQKAMEMFSFSDGSHYEKQVVFFTTPSEGF